MDYEKKYKAALGWMKSLYGGLHGKTKEEAEKYFPELKESEDEKVKRIIHSISNKISFHLHDIFTEEEFQCFDAWSTAWLEKQGQQDDYDDNIITRDDEILQAISIGLADAEKDLGWSDFGGLSIEEIQEWLEKQSEKPTLPKWKYKKDNTPLLRDSIILNKYGCVLKSPSGAIVSDAWVLDYDELAKLPKEEITKQGEQKCIPKYKIGDYVKNTNYKGEPIYEIIYMDKECYICEYRGKERMGDKAVMHFSFDNPYLRLVQKSDDKVEPKFHQGDWITNGDYTWKIVEVKPLDYMLQSQNGSIVDDTISHVDEHFHSFTIQDAKDGDVLYSPSHRFVWIYKDNEHYHASINLNYANVVSFDNEIVVPSDVCPANRVQRSILFQKMEESNYKWDAEKKELRKIEQKPAEWSGEDETMLTNIIIMLKEGASLHFIKKDITKAVDWLKSLKPQNYWKPSEEYIHWLKWAINRMPDTEKANEAEAVLEDLLEQLKKLKG